MKITVAGLGYVGLSNAVLLAQNNEVTALDIDPARVEKVANKTSPINDAYIQSFLENEQLNLVATADPDVAFNGANLVVVATPTNYDPELNYFDVTSVEACIRQALDTALDAKIVVRSTVPVGFVETARKNFKSDRIFFAPEFLREGKALHDNLYPSRIVVGDRGEFGKKFADLLLEGAKRDAPVLLTDPTEAEAIKLFSNTYLAMRVAYFNELDSYAMTRGLNTEQIITGVGLDPSHRRSLQQPVIWVRWLLPTQRHEAAVGQLRECASEYHERHRGRQPHAQGLFGRSDFEAEP